MRWHRPHRPRRVHRVATVSDQVPPPVTSCATDAVPIDVNDDGRSRAAVRAGNDGVTFGVVEAAVERRGRGSVERHTRIRQGSDIITSNTVHVSLDRVARFDDVGDVPKEIVVRGEVEGVGRRGGR